MNIIQKSNGILAVIQARCSSSRLPGKVLRKILGKSMILYELERLMRSRRISKIVLATSTDDSDDPLVESVLPVVDVYRGNLDDVLDRYYQCAKRYRPEHVVRITGDCPVIDYQIVDAVIQQHLTEGNDFTASSEKFPDGLDTEVFRFSVLERAWKDAELPSEREHVTQYMRNHPELFKLGTYDCSDDFSTMRWTVDELEDFLFIQQIFSRLYLLNPDFLMCDILQLLREHPEVGTMNQGIQRNEGLMKSLEEDMMWKKNREKR